MVANSAIPFSGNDGALWAGKGMNTRIIAGFGVAVGPLHVIVAPELLRSQNSYWRLRDTVRFYAPPLREDRRGGGYVFPWYRSPTSIDQPLRMGDRPLRTIDPGQSSAYLHVRSAELGAATESEWWGPGRNNAIVLSDNAGGFPHLFLRTGSPLATPVGSISARLLVGGLRESNYFDTTSTNNLRAISLAALSFQPAFSSNLTLGMSRAVYGTVDDWTHVPGRILRVLGNPGRPNNRALQDSSEYVGGEDQVYSLFARVVFPRDGFELYTEWARTELPVNLRDFLIAPNHTQGYTLGFQWRRPAPADARTLLIESEITNLEQSATFRDRPVGTYYTSRKAIQGYTQRGQVLGATIGPGASSQYLGLHLTGQRLTAGTIFGRIRWNEDMHLLYNFPTFLGYCSHDVTTFVGGRAVWRGRFLSASTSMIFGNRINAWFQEQSGCPNGPSRLDIRNRTFSLTLTAGSF